MAAAAAWGGFLPRTLIKVLLITVLGTCLVTAGGRHQEHMGGIGENSGKAKCCDSDSCCFLLPEGETCQCLLPGAVLETRGEPLHSVYFPWIHAPLLSLFQAVSRGGGLSLAL